MLTLAATPTIAFPKLGWEFALPQEIVRFTLFGHEFVINWYGVIIAVGFLLALIYGLKRAKYFKIDPDRMLDVVLVSTILAFVGARLYYVLFSGELSAYLKDPVRILNVTEGGLAIYGGVLMAFITGLWMCRLRKVNVLSMFDLASLGFLIGQGIGRWGNFFNQEAFGRNTTLPWGMTGSIIKAGIRGEGYDPLLPVHPTFLYESLWCLLGFILLHILSKKAYKFKGQIVSLYFVWYGLGRFFIESLRTDSLYLGTMRVSMLLAAVSFVGGWLMYYFCKRHAARMPKVLEDLSQDVPDASLPEDAPVQPSDDPLPEETLSDDCESITTQKSEDRADISADFPVSSSGEGDAMGSMAEPGSMDESETKTDDLP